MSFNLPSRTRFTDYNLSTIIKVKLFSYIISLPIILSVYIETPYQAFNNLITRLGVKLKVIASGVVNTNVLPYMHPEFLYNFILNILN